MTEAAYLTDSDVQSFAATVDRVVDDRVVLDRTHFYPTGGGQPHDTGTLSTGDRTWRVEETTKRDTIYHHLDDTPPAQGTTVEASIDWDRRMGHMRHHTAQHLLSAVLLTEYDAETTGNQVYADRARLDCAYDRFTDTDLADIESAVNDHIDAARPVDWYELDRDTAERRLDPDRTRLAMLPDSITEVRIVEIDGVDRTACAGTHVTNTADLGTFTVTGRETKGSDEERIQFRLEAD
ncbi:MAG: alanine--tRNA ligase-related protein [Halobacteriaceae archaeon]